MKSNKTRRSYGLRVFNTSSGKTVRVWLGVRVRLIKSLLLREKVAARLGKANVALTDEEFSTQRNLHLIHHATFRYAEVGMVPLPPLGKAWIVSLFFIFPITYCVPSVIFISQKPPSGREGDHPTSAKRKVAWWKEPAKRIFFEIFMFAHSPSVTCGDSSSRSQSESCAEGAL
mgnify:CR=1 FL=1